MLRLQRLVQRRSHTFPCHVSCHGLLQLGLVAQGSKAPEALFEALGHTTHSTCTWSPGKDGERMGKGWGRYKDCGRKEIFMAMSHLTSPPMPILSSGSKKGAAKETTIGIWLGILLDHLITNLGSTSIGYSKYDCEGLYKVSEPLQQISKQDPRPWAFRYILEYICVCTYIYI